ncbi:MAG: hypothetical protein HW394_1733, partial [Acidobacteria bacterium]|nr:hypothetical protein [Acidobacteriota bacterium]
DHRLVRSNEVLEFLDPGDTLPHDDDAGVHADNLVTGGGSCSGSVPNYVRASRTGTP